MTEKQLDIITGLFSGVEISLLHLVNVLDSKGVVARSEIAASFRATAEKVPVESRNRAQIQMVLNQIARGIEGSQFGGEIGSEIRKMLH